jgi:hypothetical protein
VPLFFGCSQPQARAPVTRFGLVFVFGHLGHHGLDSDFLFPDSGVVGPALLAPGCVVMDTQSLHGLEAQSSAGAPLRCHTCSQLCHPALEPLDLLGAHGFFLLGNSREVHGVWVFCRGRMSVHSGVLVLPKT